MSKYILFKTPHTLYNINICDFDYNIAKNYLNWYLGSESTYTFGIKPLEKTIYEFLFPSLFFKSIIINEKVKFKNIDYDVISIFNIEHLEKCFKHWDNIEGYIKDYKYTWQDLYDNYKKYLDEAIIKGIIE